MIAFALGQTPTTSLLGADENNLSWTVTQPVGSNLALSVMDANGSAGGIPPVIATVVAGQKTDCIVNLVATPPFEVTSNVTGGLQTCQPWGLRIKGGSPPYILTLSEIDSPVFTNVTIPNGLDAFTYINRANPGSQLYAAVSDSTGRWATGTPVVNTTGSCSADVTCPGLISSSGDAATLDKEAEAPSVVGSAKLKLSAPRQWHDDSLDAAVGHPIGGGGLAKLPTTSIHRSAKAMEVAAVQNRSSAAAHSQDRIPARLSARRNSTIFQHQDAGSVRELPPPYVDRTLLSAELAQ
ncbi:hypothetical protein D9613_009708 [Agrocybe pediades]|uniref:Uncharacterized protein n=1 Tax=Agrocybe pediades TaxID=84607 RepID=A0A8H4QWK1_9AGAR|nr:hypothetical protein D9613_009708 [Agrocybe pediades]